jgi:hypothetical protein
VATHPEWDIRGEGRACRGDEASSRYLLTPEKFEMVGGKLLWSDEDRETLLIAAAEARRPTAEARTQPAPGTHWEGTVLR